MTGYFSDRVLTALPGWLRALAICSIAVLVAATGPSPAWALPDSSFEATDGDLLPNGGTDWESFLGAGLVVGPDNPQGQEDDSFSGKEDDPVPEIVTGSIPKNKSDLLRFYVTSEKVDVGTDADKVFLYLGWVRANTLGSANMDFEFSQSGTLSGNGVTPERTVGDLLITFGFSGNNNTVTLGLSRWVDTGPCEASSTTPCWGPIVPLGGFAEGSVNAVDVFDPVEGTTLIPGTFGEAVINLTDAGVFDLDECVTFGSAYVKSRSSTSFTSQLKDFIEPIDVSVSNCATVTVTKNAIPDDDQDFHFNGPPELGAESFFLDDDGDDGNALASSAIFEANFSGTLTISEDPVDGWDLTDVSCEVAGGAPGTDTSGGEATLDVGAGDTVSCTFTNTKRGRILVHQTTNPGADPQLFGFALSGGPAEDLVDQAFNLADGSPAHDTGEIRPGSYTLGQLDPGAEWDLTSATCDDGSDPASISLDPGETVICTFVNTKRGRILVDQVTDPTADPASFDFTLAGGPGDAAIDQAFSLTDVAVPHDSDLVKPGSYAAIQLPTSSEWDLESATCDDGSSPGAIAIDPGETVTCTFTNIRRGRILVDVVTDPSADPHVFDFGMTGGPGELDASFGLSDESAPHDSGAVQPGAYAVSHTAPGAEWDLGGAVCDDGSDPSAISLEAGETVTCTYTFVKRGHVLVDVTTDPAGDAQVFDFSLSGGPADASLDQAFGLADATAPHDSGPAKAGIYVASALYAEADWDLVGAACSDGSNPSAVAVEPGETVTCTFDYVKRGHILVDVVTDPSGDPQMFDLGLGGGPADAPIDQTFSLADITPPHDSGVIKPGTYQASPAPSDSEWDLAGAVCDDQSAPVAVQLDPGETVTCTFTYVKRAHILVDVVTDPAGDSQSFGFGLAGGPAEATVDQSFALTDTSSPHDSGPVKAGSYAATPDPAGAEWDLDSATCDNGNSPSSVSVGAGETVTCTFTYIKRGHIRIDKVTVPSGDPQSFGFTLAGGPDGVDAATSLTDGATAYDSGPIRPGTYAAVEADSGAGWDLTGATCDDGSAPGSISLEPGETVTCTFTNTKRAILTIVKESIPDDPQDFGFTITGADYNGALTLDDDDDATLPKSGSMLLVNGSYVIVESDPGLMWDLTGLRCVDSGGSKLGSMDLANRMASVDLAPGADVTCVFTDTKRGRIFVEKYVVNEYTGVGFNPHDFPFDFDPDWGPVFSLKHGEVHDSDWIRGAVTHSVSENPPPKWQVRSECTYADQTVQTGGSSIQIDLPPGEEVYCTFSNELKIHPGSSGFWKNWRNHYDQGQFFLIMRESLDDSLVYNDLFEGNGDLIDSAYDTIMGLYDNGGASGEQALIRELTTMMFNLGVTKEPLLDGLRSGDGLCLDCVVKADEVPGGPELLERLASCPAGDGIWRVQDVLDIVEASWIGNLATPTYSVSLTGSEVSILTALADGINDGRYMKVDASGYPNDLKCLSAPGPVTATLFRDADHDGYGIFRDRLQVCDGTTPEGWALDFGDCDDSEPLSNPGLAESPCDGIDNNCDGVVDVEDGDADGDGVTDMCDSFPDDPDRSGPFHLGTLSAIDDLWRTIAVPGPYQNPVVIVGLPTNNDGDPGVIQVHGVTAREFGIRFADWNYQDGYRNATESVPYIVMESGRYVMDDGSIWEFGTFDIANTGHFRNETFPAPFPGPPALFLSAQTAYGSDPYTARARNVTTDGFQVTLYEEQVLMDGHGWEDLGYLAIHSPDRSGSITVAGTELPYLLQTPRIKSDFAPVLSWTVKLDEEQSMDEEQIHLRETIDVLALGSHLFGQDVSVRGSDVHTLRRLDPEASVAMEWGTIDDVDGKWMRVPLAKSYTDPVVIAKIASSRDMEPGVVRLRNITNDSFEVRFEEWSYLDGIHSGERVFYIVAEKGQHDLGGLMVEAGTVNTGALLNAGAWENVALTAPFFGAPAVFASVQTRENTTPVATRVSRRTSLGFRIAMQEEEASIADGRAAENVGWIAMDRGTGVTAGGRLIEVLMGTANDEYSTVHFTPSDARAFRTVVADMVSVAGVNPATLRHDNLGRNEVDLVVQEEQSKDEEMDHLDEDVCLFVAE